MPYRGEPFQITTPIYYVNGDPHMGHAYTTVAADVAARHARRCGAEAFFLTGTDEHGAKVAQAAAEAGLTPKQFADPIAERFRDLARDLHARNDFFIRTTDPEHEAFVQLFVARMRAAGDLYESTYSGLYCTACEAFYAEADLIDGLCPQHGTKPTFTEERNTFFRLSAYADRLLERYAASPPFVLPPVRLNEVRSFVEGGLEDVSITREAVKWGIPLPWDTSQAIYVWIDALINYTSALTYARPGVDLSAELWPARWQLLGKDILRFHAVIWPAMLLSAGYEMPRQLFIHGMLLGHDGFRMSKTRGNGMDPYPVIEAYGADALRYYLMREVHFGQDGPIGYASMHQRYHGELANDLGNLVNRTVAMVTRYRDGIVPQAQVDGEIKTLAARVVVQVGASLEQLELTGALEQAWELVRALNRFVEESAPWALAKSDDPAAAAKLDSTLATLCEGCRLLGVLLAPYLPERVELLFAALGEPVEIGWEHTQVRPGSGRHVDSTSATLFPRVDAAPA